MGQHVDADELISISRKEGIAERAHHIKNNLATPYSSRYGSTEDIPKFTLPPNGINANAAYQLIHDELDFDGKPNLNLASFVGTYMEPEAVPPDPLPRSPCLLFLPKEGVSLSSVGGLLRLTLGKIDYGEFVEESFRCG